MRIKLVILSLAFAATAAYAAAPATSSSSANHGETLSDGGSGFRPVPSVNRPSAGSSPFTHVAFGGGISPLGINMQAATNLNRHSNLRFSGNFFNFAENNLSTNGFTVNAKANLESIGTSLDIYPFANHGFRLSPGVLIHNANGFNGTFTAQAGTSFDLNGYTYYSSSQDPVKGNGLVGLHSQNPAFTMTTGWGNMIPRSGKHLSFPFEIGAAFVGAPTVNLTLTSGQVCDSQGLNCVNVATDPNVQANLQAQVAKYRNDLEPLKTYPIISFGVAYSFGTRGGVR